MAHLCVVLVFLVRFQLTFHKNTVFNDRAHTIRWLYSCLAILTVFGIVIVILMCIEHTVTEIMILEIIWEILVDVMCLWLLWLFMSKLYQLLLLSLTSRIKTGVHTRSDLLRQIIEATKATITQSKSENSKSDSNKSKRSGSGRKKKRKYEPKSQLTMTIDGLKVKPIHSNKSAGSKPGSVRSSPAQSPEPDPVSMNTEYRSQGQTELTITTKALSDNDQTDNDQTDNEQTDNERVETQSSGTKGESAAIDLIGVMTKITLLVCFTVFVSVVGVIGNVYIEVQEMKYIEKHDIAVEEIWADILPITDVIITSLMLYLQFNFTHVTYRRIFGRLDVWFLSRCLGCVEWWWNRNITDNEEKTASFLYDTQSTKFKSLEILSRPP
eukprot:291312_1